MNAAEPSAAAPLATTETRDQQRLRLALATLESVTCFCDDAMELSRCDTDAETVLRLMADRVRYLGAQVATVSLVLVEGNRAGRSTGEVDAWLLSPLQQELALPLRGQS